MNTRGSNQALGTSESLLQAQMGEATPPLILPLRGKGRLASKSIQATQTLSHTKQIGKPERWK